MLRSRLVLCCVLFSSSALAADSPARLLAAELLVLTGTAAVFESPQVRAALADPEPFLGPMAGLRRARLLEDSGFRRWEGPRVWILQSRRDGAVERWENLASRHAAEAHARGYWLLDALPLQSAEEALSFLAPGKDHPGLPALLKAYGADVLVLVRDQAWSLWARGAVRQGAMPGRSELFPAVLAEVLAALQQWPEAGDRVVLQVSGVDGLADFAKVQEALQALPGDRQVRLARAAPRQVWFALTAPDREALAQALDAEPRLPSAVEGEAAGLPAGAIEARRLASPLIRRQWVPDATPRQAPAAAAPSASF